MVKEHSLYDLNPFKLIDLFSYTEYGLSWLMFWVHLKRICILLLLSGVFYKQQLGPVG